MKHFFTIAFLLIFSPASAQLSHYDLNKAGGSNVHGFTVYNNSLYFYGYDTAHGCELWVYDGSSLPHIVYDIIPGPLSSYPDGIIGDNMMVVNNKLYFLATNDTSYYELFVYDGVNPPHIAADINPAGSSNILDPVADNGIIYVSALTPASGQELWSFNPATNTITQITDLRPGALGSEVGSIIAFKGKIYFAGTTSAAGNELYVFDPATKAISLAAELEPGAVGSYPRYMSVIDQKLYFNATLSVGGTQLFMFDGSTPPTSIASGVGNSKPVGFGDKVYFSKSNMMGSGLAAYDPALNKTTAVLVTAHHADNTYLSSQVYNSKLYFATSDSVHGAEPWVYDGKNTPFMLADIYPGMGNSWPSGLIVYKGSLFFQASEPTDGTELYRFDDTSSSVLNVGNIRQLKVYPNPTTGNCSLELNIVQPEELKLVIYNIEGKEMLSMQIEKHNAQNPVYLNLETYLPGTYFYKLTNSNNTLQAAGKIEKL